MAQKKILVVDDEKKMREAAEKTLTDAGYMVVFGCDGEEAIEQAREHHPDLILMDVMMPKMDGGQAVNVLKEDPAMKNIPVIFLSSIITKEEEAQRNEAPEEGGIRHHYMAKPYEPAKLLKLIEKILAEQE